MSIWVAYNDYGDLIAEADTRDELCMEIEAAGYEVQEVTIGRVTP